MKILAAVVALIALAGAPALRTICLWSCEPGASMPLAGAHCHEDLATDTKLSAAHECPSDNTGPGRSALRLDPVSIAQPPTAAHDSPAPVADRVTTAFSLDLLHPAPRHDTSAIPLRI